MLQSARQQTPTTMIDCSLTAVLVCRILILYSYYDRQYRTVPCMDYNLEDVLVCSSAHKY